MQKTENRRILIVEAVESDAFDQAILFLKENVVREEEIVVNEARAVVMKYMKKYEKGIRNFKRGRKRVMSYLFASGGGILVGAVITFLLF